ncbi:MAG: hypothetical protein WC947_09460 [Elusimicrobiota bacterium]
MNTKKIELGNGYTRIANDYRGLTTNTTKATVHHIFSFTRPGRVKEKLNLFVVFVVKVVTKIKSEVYNER